MSEILPPLYPPRRAATFERPTGEPDIGLCARLIGLGRCRAEHGFNATSGRFAMTCRAAHCPVRDAPKTAMVGGGSHYRPPARKRQ